MIFLCLLFIILEVQLKLLQIGQPEAGQSESGKLADWLAGWLTASARSPARKICCLFQLE